MRYKYMKVFINMSACLCWCIRGRMFERVWCVYIDVLACLYIYLFHVCLLVLLPCMSMLVYMNICTYMPPPPFYVYTSVRVHLCVHKKEK